MNVRINEDLIKYLPVWTSHRLARALPGRERRPGCLDQRAELGLGSTSSESAGKDLSSYTIVSLSSLTQHFPSTVICCPHDITVSSVSSNHRINKKKIGRGDFLKVTA